MMMDEIRHGIIVSQDHDMNLVSIVAQLNIVDLKTRGGYCERIQSRDSNDF